GVQRVPAPSSAAHAVLRRHCLHHGRMGRGSTIREESPMQIKSITSLVLACAFALGTGIAAAAQDDGATGPSGKPLTTQQLRMKNCNAEARAQSLKGDERKAFMSTCLKGGA